MEIIELLAQDNYLMYNINIANTLGIYEAILIGELAYKYNCCKINDKLTEDDYFFITREDIEKDTGLSDYQQSKAFKHLVDEGIVDIKKKGCTDRSNYYKIFTVTLLKYLSI